MSVSYRKQKLFFFAWKVFLLLLLASNSNPLCFSAHSGGNLLPEPGVILDAGSLVAVVVKEVAVISAPLFGGPKIKGEKIFLGVSSLCIGRPMVASF